MRLTAGRLLVRLVGCASFPSAATCQVANGDFSAGNTGFVSGYTYIPSGLGMDPGDYGVRTDPTSLNINWTPFGDHTTGAGNMLLVDGSLAANTTVWSETVAVVPHAAYT